MKENTPARRLKSLEATDEMSYSLDNPFDDPSGWKQCQLHVNTSWVLGCDGSRIRSGTYTSKMNFLFSFSVEASSNSFSMQVSEKA